MPGPATGRKIQGRAEAAIRLAEWEASGEPMILWCEKRGLNWYSLSAFKGHGVREEVPTAELVEVEFDVPQLPTSERTSWYRIAMDHAVVEVCDDFRDDTLRRLLRVVASC